MMEASNFDLRDENVPLIINVKGGASMLHSVVRVQNEYVWIFEGGSRLVSRAVGVWSSQGAYLEHSVGDWSVILEDGSEVCLPKDKKWRIVFEEGEKIVSIPYKTLIFGQWALVTGEGAEGTVLVYLGNMNYIDNQGEKVYSPCFRTHFKYDISKRTERKRTEKFKKEAVTMMRTTMTMMKTISCVL
jgi:hypothetical protein